MNFRVWLHQAREPDPRNSNFETYSQSHAKTVKYRATEYDAITYQDQTMNAHGTSHPYLERVGLNPTFSHV